MSRLIATPTSAFWRQGCSFSWQSFRTGRISSTNSTGPQRSKHGEETVNLCLPSRTGSAWSTCEIHVHLRIVHIASELPAAAPTLLCKPTPTRYRYFRSSGRVWRVSMLCSVTAGSASRLRRAGQASIRPICSCAHIQHHVQLSVFISCRCTRWKREWSSTSNKCPTKRRLRGALQSGHTLRTASALNPMNGEHKGCKGYVRRPRAYLFCPGMIVSAVLLSPEVGCRAQVSSPHASAYTFNICTVVMGCGARQGGQCSMLLWCRSMVKVQTSPGSCTTELLRPNK